MIYVYTRSHMRCNKSTRSGLPDSPTLRPLLFPVVPRVFRPTWFATLPDACASCPHFHCTTSCTPLTLALVTYALLDPYMRDEYFRSLAPPLLFPARLVGQHRSALGRAAHALRRVECDHVPCLATTQTLSLGASEMNTASIARGLRIRRIVPTGGAEAEDASFEVEGARADSLTMS